MNSSDPQKNQNKQIFRHTLVQASAFLVVILCAILFFFVIFSYNTWTGKLAYLVSGLKSIIIGIAIAYLLNPLVGSMEKRLQFVIRDAKNPKRAAGTLRAFCAILVVLMTLLIAGVLLYAILPQVVSSISALIRNSPTYVDEVTNLIQSNRQLQEFLDNILTNATDVIAEWLTDNVLVNIQKYVSLAASGVFDVLLVLMDVLVGLIISVLVGVTNVIPFFGPYIGMIPSAILVMLVDFKKGVIVLIFIIILQQLDGNVISPKILGKSTGLSAFWVVFSVMFFGKLWGVLGMLLGVPVFGVIYYIAETFVNYRLGLRQMPKETESYTNLDYFAEDGTRVTLDGKKTARELRKEEQKELRRQWMEENQENFEHWLSKRKKKEEEGTNAPSDPHK